MATKTQAPKKRGRKFHQDRAEKQAEKLRPKDGSVSLSVTDPETGEVTTATLGSDGSGSAEAMIDVAETAVRGAVQAAKRVPMADKPASLRLHIPTDIGLVCSEESSRYSLDAVAVIRSPECPDDVLLAATDGRMLAVVATTIEEDGDCEAAGLKASWVPARLARVGKQERTLRMAHGAKDGLFGSTRTWVDDAGSVFAPHPEGGTFPPIGDVLPASDDSDVYVKINAAAMMALAKAVNSPDAESRDAVTLIIRRGKVPGTAVDRAIGVIGNVGIGVLMPIKCDQKASRETWTRARQTAIAASEACELVRELKDPEAFDRDEDGSECGPE